MSTEVSSPNIARLRVLLAAHPGVRVIEERGALAVVGAPVEGMADPAVRRRVSHLARQAGFTHVALELDPPT